MNVNKMAGYCLIVFGLINVLQEIHLRTVAKGQPGIGFALTTSILFTAGAVLLWRRRIRENLAKARESKIK
ncbi:MAG: hypothetical protein M3R67_04100 [Acidobacteriota bacterium]|nr:hypothetical protein [Acidobacteriota bacterium]